MPPKQIRKKRNHTPKSSRAKSPIISKKKSSHSKRTIRGGAAVDSVIQNITDGIDTIVETIGSRSIVDFIRGRSDGNSATNQASDSINKMSETLRKLKKQLNRKTVDDTTFVLAKKASELDKDIRRVLDSFERKTSLQKDNAATLKSIVLRKLVIQHLKTQNDFMQGVKPVTSGVSGEAAKLPSNDEVLDIQISQTELPEKYRTSNNDMTNETYDLKLSIDELNKNPNLDFDKIFTNLKTLMDLKDNIKEGEDLEEKFITRLIDEMKNQDHHYATVPRNANSKTCYVDRPTIIKLAKSYGISINEIKDECDNLGLTEIKTTIETKRKEEARLEEAKKELEEAEKKLEEAKKELEEAESSIEAASASGSGISNLNEANKKVVEEAKKRITDAQARKDIAKKKVDDINKIIDSLTGSKLGGNRSKSNRKSMNKSMSKKNAKSTTKSKSKKNI